MRDDNQVRANISLALHFPAVCLELSALLCHYSTAASFCLVCLFFYRKKKRPPVCNISVLQILCRPEKKNNPLSFLGTEAYFAFHIPK